MKTKALILFSIALIICGAVFAEDGVSNKIPILAEIKLEDGETNLTKKTIFVNRDELRQIAEKNIEKRNAERKANETKNANPKQTYQIILMFEYDDVRVYKFVDPLTGVWHYFSKQLCFPNGYVH